MSNPVADSPTAPLPFARQLTEKAWFNALWFQTTWFCAVLGQDTLLAVTLGLIGLHFALVPLRGRELRQLFLLGGSGMAVDASLSALGVFRFTDGVLLPLWLCGLWLAFATTLGRSLVFFASRPWLTAAAGALVLPFNYYAGSQLGAVEFGWPLWQSLLMMSAIWSLTLPALYYLQQRLFQAKE